MATGGKAETTPIMLADDDNPNSLEAKEARLQMRRESGESVPKSFVRKLERKKGAR